MIPNGFFIIHEPSFLFFATYENTKTFSWQKSQKTSEAR